LKVTITVKRSNKNERLSMRVEYNCIAWLQSLSVLPISIHDPAAMKFTIIKCFFKSILTGCVIRLPKKNYMLFCKPARKTGIAFEQPIPANTNVTIRSLELKRDICYLHKWRHVSIETVYVQYKDFLNDKSTHSFVGLFKHKRICVIDVSGASASVLRQHIRLRPDDCSMELLINPVSNESADVVQAVIHTFICYYLSFPQAQFLYSTPGIYEYTLCRILEQSGFTFQENIILPSKAASLYLLTRSRFLLKK